MSRITTILAPYACLPLDQNDYIEVNVDTYWRETTTLSEEDFNLEATKREFWDIMLPHWLPIKEARKRFISHFWDKGKANQRANAVLGTTEKNRQYARWIIDACHHFHINPLDYLPDESENTPHMAQPLTIGEEGKLIDRTDLGYILIDLIAENKTKTLKQIIEICSKPIEEPLGGAPEESKKYWSAFTSYLKEHDRLPTRREINTRSMVNPSSCDKVLKRLGLEALQPSLNS